MHARRQARDHESGRQREGPRRGRDDRRRRTRRPVEARRHDRRADLGQHRRRARDRRRAARLPLHLRDERQDERREGRAAARVRRRGGGVPDRGAARRSRARTTRRPSGSCGRRRARSGPTSIRTRPTRSRTSARPAPRSGSRRAGASPTSSRASAPAARSPASGGSSSRRTRTCRSSAPIPSGSVYSGGTGRPYLTEGIGEDFWPTTFDPPIVDRVIEVSDADAFLTARRVTRDEGLLIGGSGGTAVHARARPSARELRSRRRRRRAASPTPAAATSRRSTPTRGCSHMGFLRADGPVAGDVLATKGDDMRRARAHHARTAGPRRDHADARDRCVAARRLGHDRAAARGEGSRRARCASSS